MNEAEDGCELLRRQSDPREEFTLHLMQADAKALGEPIDP